MNWLRGIGLPPNLSELAASDEPPAFALVRTLFVVQQHLYICLRAVDNTHTVNLVSILRAYIYTFFGERVEVFVVRRLGTGIASGSLCLSPRHLFRDCSELSVVFIYPPCPDSDSK